MPSPREDVLAALQTELTQAQERLKDFSSDWRKRVPSKVHVAEVEVIQAHIREVLRLMAALALQEPRADRFSKALGD